MTNVVFFSAPQLCFVYTIRSSAEHCFGSEESLLVWNHDQSPELVAHLNPEKDTDAAGRVVAVIGAV